MKNRNVSTDVQDTFDIDFETISEESEVGK